MEVNSFQNNKDDKRTWYLQFLMSEMKTANPRIPSPFDTAGMFKDFCPQSGLVRENEPTSVTFHNRLEWKSGQFDVLVIATD